MGPMKGKYRRLFVHAAVAVVVGTASIRGVALATDNGRGPVKPAGTSTSSPATGDIIQAAHDALEALVSQGTINQSQADAVQQEVEAGSVEPKMLVDEGVVTEAQMRAIGNSLDQVKRSFGG